MTAGPPFERYPGPPPDSGDVCRVISPYRDALAWISVAGRLSLARFLLREGDGWRTVVDTASEADSGSGTGWSLVHRDPVEVVLDASLPNGVVVRASVTVGRAGCEVRINPALAPCELDELIDTGEWFSVRAD